MNLWFFVQYKVIPIQDFFQWIQAIQTVFKAFISNEFKLFQGILEVHATHSSGSNSRLFNELKLFWWVEVIPINSSLYFQWIQVFISNKLKVFQWIQYVCLIHSTGSNSKLSNEFKIVQCIQV